jgi:thiamine-phosphate pyrophosphorylase
MKSRISRNTPKAFSTSRRPFFYYITNRRQLTGPAFEACIRRVLRWGVDCIQVREKDLSDRILFEKVRHVVDLARGTDCKILVNGRADIAMAAGAHGVHLPSTGLRPPDIRSWLPGDFLIGISVHTDEEIRRACDEGADYLLLGHVFPTPSKSGLGKPVGLEFLKKVCGTASLPVFALGGIHADKIGPAVEAGATGVAGISLFQNKEEFAALKNAYPFGPHAA